MKIYGRFDKQMFTRILIIILYITFCGILGHYLIGLFEKLGIINNIFLSLFAVFTQNFLHPHTDLHLI